MSLENKHVIIFSMRRSGSTAFWESFRASEHYHCLDEPFNPRLAELPCEHRKGTRQEFINIYNRDPLTFKRYFAPIYRSEELEPTITIQQIEYLRWLRDSSSKPTMIGITRCNSKMNSVIMNFPDSVFIYLFRSASQVARSHLVPSDRADLLQIRKRINSAIMFSQFARYNSWGYQDILAGPYSDKLPAQMASVEIDYRKDDSPHIQLLKYWLLNYRMANDARHLATSTGTPFYILSFDEFCADPAGYIEAAAKSWLSQPHNYVDSSNIAAPRILSAEERRRWLASAKIAGFTQDELQLV